MTLTTIKVSTQTRDLINDLAAANGLTAGSLVEKVLDDYLWRKQVEAAKEQLLAAPKEVWDDYLAESRTMDGSLPDGLSDIPW